MNSKKILLLLIFLFSLLNFNKTFALYNDEKGKPYTGVVKDNLDISFYEKGRPVGKWLTFYPNGDIKSIQNWKNGKLNGKYVLYNNNRTKSIQEYYTDGVDDGIYLIYYPNGMISIRGAFKKGKPYGKWEYYDKNGRLINTTKY